MRDTFDFRSGSNFARFPSKMESWVQSCRPRATESCDFSFHLSKVLRLLRKSGAMSHTKCCACHTKRIALANLKTWFSKMQHFSQKQCLDLLRSLMDMSLVVRLPRLLFKYPTPADVFGNAAKPSCLAHAHFREGAQTLASARRRELRMWTSKSRPRALVFQHFWLWNVLRAITECTIWTSRLPKLFWTSCALYILTLTCASPDNGGHFFDTSTSKSGPRPSDFNTLGFETCFAPQQRATFHLSSGQLAPHPPL